MNYNSTSSTLHPVLKHMLLEQRQNGSIFNHLSLRALIDLAPGTLVSILTSGGLDSATMIALASSANLKIQTIEFLRSDRPISEAIYSQRLASRFSNEHITVEYPAPRKRLEDNVFNLPELYSVYLTIGAAIAKQARSRYLFSGLIYEDWASDSETATSTDMLGAVNKLILSEEAGASIQVAAPFAFSSKATIAALSLVLGLSVEESQSCLMPQNGRPCSSCQQCHVFFF
ncbi:7-cyano-7-deazaguanine synthase, partial [Pseudovibrio sp. Ad26]|uniref:7-cyano-7-deazaguanine synthase n=1 Tax=Pseudovibrio sp. Ad26 TaxID=989410 RepID=UPI00128FFC2D